MAYGLQVPTINGTMDVTSLSVLRMVHRSRRTVAAGSTSFGAGFLANAIVVGIPNDGKMPPQITVSVVDGAVQWSAPSYFSDVASSDFDLTVFRIG
ncbi:hypothetical protein [Paracoccus chinensis]|uniref:Uncharacterized protein n=1 Tax=Paracoccus chinensis TaxID=525640 RepID=A0A1G9JIZ5_9RHOB|nr:hypothetical protein [Paracoccus chinensis]SDL37371.1 hypothetical protein SAMN04487971_109152 [Paracoccus chinensis]